MKFKNIIPVAFGCLVIAAYAPKNTAKKKSLPRITNINYKLTKSDAG